MSGDTSLPSTAMSEPQVTKHVYIASDHAGFALKATLIEKLKSRGIDVVDVGPATFDPGDDYPDYIKPLAAQVAQNTGSCGIVIGKSGQGEAMGSNRTQGVRALVYTGGNLEIVRLSREDNDANVLAIAAGFVPEDEAWEAVELFLATPFSHAERHMRRIQKLDE